MTYILAASWACTLAMCLFISKKRLRKGDQNIRRKWADNFFIVDESNRAFLQRLSFLLFLALRGKNSREIFESNFYDNNLKKPSVMACNYGNTLHRYLKFSKNTIRSLLSWWVHFCPSSLLIFKPDMCYQNYQKINLMKYDMNVEHQHRCADDDNIFVPHSVTHIFCQNFSAFTTTRLTFIWEYPVVVKVSGVSSSSCQSISLKVKS